MADLPGDIPGENLKAWLDRTPEAALEPSQPIIDPHHHLWDRRPRPDLGPDNRQHLQSSASPISLGTPALSRMSCGRTWRRAGTSAASATPTAGMPRPTCRSRIIPPGARKACSARRRFAGGSPCSPSSVSPSIAGATTVSSARWLRWRGTTPMSPSSSTTSAVPSRWGRMPTNASGCSTSGGPASTRWPPVRTSWRKSAAAAWSPTGSASRSATTRPTARHWPRPGHRISPT